MSEIKDRDSLLKDNIARLYDDLLRVQNWRLERPFPHCYATDRTWTDLNKMELNLRDQIRRELKDAAKDGAFARKDLRETLIEFKQQQQKANMLDLSSLEQTVEGGTIKPEGFFKQAGDLYQRQNPYQSEQA